MLRRLATVALLATMALGALSACTSHGTASGVLPATQQHHPEDSGGGVPGG